MKVTKREVWNELKASPISIAILVFCALTVLAYPVIWAMFR